jgi:hypothetical protein
MFRVYEIKRQANVAYGPQSKDDDGRAHTYGMAERDSIAMLTDWEAQVRDLAGPNIIGMGQNHASNDGTHKRFYSDTFGTNISIHLQRTPQGNTVEGAFTNFLAIRFLSGSERKPGIVKYFEEAFSTEAPATFTDHKEAKDLDWAEF